VLMRNGRTGGSAVRNKYGALLKGLLRCEPCNCSMGHAYSTNGSKRYRYYVCLNAQKRGWKNCPSKSVPAGDIEKFVIDQIKAIGKDPAVLAATIRQAHGQGQKALAELRAQERMLQKELAGLNAALRKAEAVGGRQVEVIHTQDGIRDAERRLTLVREEILARSNEIVDSHEVESALSVFDPVWQTLSPKEQARIIRLLVERVDYNGKDSTIGITFRPNGIKTLAQQLPEAA